MGDDGELQFADSERTDSYESDSEMDLYDYWNCAQCHAKNNNPLYRYCHKCFQVYIADRLITYAHVHRMCRHRNIREFFTGNVYAM